MPVLSILLFYRSVEFASSENGKCVIGLTYKYRMIKLICMVNFSWMNFLLGDIKREITAGKNMVISWVSNTTMHSTLIIYCCS
jgi:hypothetical protein